VDAEEENETTDGSNEKDNAVGYGRSE